MYDVNGNVTQLSDQSDSSMADLYEYDPYGNLLTTPTGAAPKVMWDSLLIEY